MSDLKNRNVNEEPYRTRTQPLEERAPALKGAQGNRFCKGWKKQRLDSVFAKEIQLSWCSTGGAVSSVEAVGPSPAPQASLVPLLAEHSRKRGGAMEKQD
jgi:hypothetical protein